MIINADLLAKGIEMLNTYLTEGAVTVNFTKQDGKDRTMRCTRDMRLIPFEKQPKPKTVKVTDGDLSYTYVELPKEHDPQLFKVWDLDKQAWRSFRYTTIKSMAIVE